MQWIKASERLPKKAGYYVIKHYYREVPDVIANVDYHEFKDGGFAFEDEVFKLMWLDETPSTPIPPAQVSDKELEESGQAVGVKLRQKVDEMIRDAYDTTEYDLREEIDKITSDLNERIESYNLNSKPFQRIVGRILFNDESAVQLYSLEQLIKAWSAFRMRGFPHNTDTYGNETFEQFLSSIQPPPAS